jgi:hypothetical protein
MTMPQRITDEWEFIARRHKAARVFALIDGLQYSQETGNPPDASDPALTGLFVGTEDEPLAHAGPWLVDIAVSGTHATVIAPLEASRPAVVWLISTDDAQTLADKLRERLNATMPDGREVLLRLWDPRAIDALGRSTDRAARDELFGVALLWSYLRDGKAYYIRTGEKEA